MPGRILTRRDMLDLITWLNERYGMGVETDRELALLANVCYERYGIETEILE